MKQLIERPVAALSALLLVSACDRQAANTSADPARTSDAVTAAAQPNLAVLSAAEPFEALTEQSFTADWATLDRIIADADKAASGAPLRPDRLSLLKERMVAIAQARTDQNRVGLALAAVEGYRELVESQDRSTTDRTVPISLLDYAGFRYDALAQAPTVDWGEMSRSVDFARAQWNTLAPSMQSKALAGVMAEALGGMAKAVEQKDVIFARSAAATELALVDLLEELAASGK